MVRNRSSSDVVTGATRSTAMPSASRRPSSSVTISRSTGASGESVTRMPPLCSAARATLGTEASRPAARTRGAASMSISRVWVGDQVGDRALRDDVAVVDDRGDVAGLLDLVEQVRGEQHGAALGDQLADQVAELEDAGRVEPVDRLVEDQQLGVAEQAAGDAEALAHAERVGADLVVGAAAEADALERGVDAPVGALVARRGVHVQVLAAGEVAVEARLLDDRADARQRLRAVVRVPSRRIVPLVGFASPSSSRISVVLPAPLGPRKPNAQPRGTSRSMCSRAARSPKRFPRPWVWMARSVMAAKLRPGGRRAYRPGGGTVGGRLIRSDELAA